MYIILFEEDRKLLPWEHDEFFMNLTGFSKYDVRQILRKSRGILQMLITEEQAQQIKQYFQSKNINCHIEEESNIPSIPKAKKSNFFDVADNKMSFYFSKGYNKLSEIAFENIGIFSLAFFPGPKFAASKIDTYMNILPDTMKIQDEQLRKELKEKIGEISLKREKGIDTNLARKGFITKSDLSNLKKEDIKIYLDIFSCDLQTRMRLVSSDLSYEILQQDATLNSITNFLNILDFLIKTVGSVNLTPKILEFLETQDYFSCMFESEEEFDTYNIWYIYNLIKNIPTEETSQSETDNQQTEQ